MSRVAELYAGGLTMYEVAAELGMTYGAVKWALKREGVPIRNRHEARLLTITMRSHLTVEQMIALYGDGKSLREIAEVAKIDPKAVSARLDMAGVPRRSRVDAVRLSKGKRKRPSRPPAARAKREYQGEYVEGPPPMTSNELAELHKLSASERMLMLRVAATLKEGAVDGESERILYEAGIGHPRRQYHIMTCAIAAVKESGFSLKQRRAG